MTTPGAPTADAAGLHVLHIGAGYRPLRRGGLIAYVEDLMTEQARRGQRASYLFSGRFFPLRRRPWLRRWERAGVEMFEIVNSPLHDHGRQPELELNEPAVERLIRDVIEECRPDVVHVQELAGLPSSVLEIAGDLGVPVVMTLQDYFPLCPTFKLLDASGRSCLEHAPGEGCLAAALADQRPPNLLYEASVAHELLERVPAMGRLSLVGARAITSRSGRRGSSALRDRSRAAAAYRRRREINVQRLNGADAVLAMSTRVAALYRQLGVTTPRLKSMQLTLSHIERLSPRRVSVEGTPVTFATLGGGESDAKGAALLLEAARQVSETLGPSRFRLVFCGHVTPEIADRAAVTPGVEVRGPYRPDQLDSLLDEMHVGLMPSVWEEAYGYAGMEFLAKGIPVLANAIGGMVDYVRDGETGWLNESCTADGLAEIMRSIIERPQQIAFLSQRLVADRDAIVMTMARHADEMETVYRDVIRGRRDPAA